MFGIAVEDLSSTCGASKPPTIEPFEVKANACSHRRKLLAEFGSLPNSGRNLLEQRGETSWSVSREPTWASSGQESWLYVTTAAGDLMHAQAGYGAQMQEQWTLSASPETTSRMRALVERFCSERSIDPGRANDIKLAVTEAANNAAQHAYVGRSPGPVTLVAWLEVKDVLIELRDEGQGITPRVDSPGTGLGLPTMGRLADQLDITAGPSGDGTIVRMRFRSRPLN